MGRTINNSKTPIAMGNCNRWIVTLYFFSAQDGSTRGHASNKMQQEGMALCLSVRMSFPREHKYKNDKYTSYRWPEGYSYRGACCNVRCVDGIAMRIQVVGFIARTSDKTTSRQRRGALSTPVRPHPKDGRCNICREVPVWPSVQPTTVLVPTKIPTTCTVKSTLKRSL